jgi:plastocyanin
MSLRLVVTVFCILVAHLQLAPPAHAQFAQQAPQLAQPGQIDPRLGQLLSQRPDLLAANIRSLAELDQTVELRPGDTVIWDTAPGQTHSVLFLPFGTGESLNFGDVEQVLDFGQNRSKLRIESNGAARTQAGSGELLRATVRDDAPGKLEEIQFWCEVHLSLGMTKRIAVAMEEPPAGYQPKTVRFRGDGVTWSVGTGALPPPPVTGGGGMAMMCPGMQMMSGMMGGGGMGMMGGGPAATAMAGAQGITGAGGCAGGLCALPGAAGQQQAMLGMPVAGAGMGMMGGMGGMMGGGGMGMMGGGQGMMGGTGGMMGGGGTGMMGGGQGMMGGTGGMMGGGGTGMMGGGQGMMQQLNLPTGLSPMPNAPTGLTPMPNAPTGLTPMPQDMGSPSGDMGMGSTPRPPAATRPRGC